MPADIVEYRVEADDIYLLNSDGLTDMVDPDVVQSIIVKKRATSRRRPTELVDVANQNGGRDNISVVLVRVPPEFLPSTAWAQRWLAQEAGELGRVAMGKLVLLHADGKAREIRLDRERITIGRRADNDICLPYPAVSGEHAAVVTILADSFLEDLGSTNGTLVNGGLGHQAFPARPRPDRHRTGDPRLPGRRCGHARGAAGNGPQPRGARQDGSAAAAAPMARAGASVVTGAQRAKRRSDPVAPEPAADAPDSLERSFVADFEGAAARPPAAAPDAGIAAVPALPPERQAGPVPALKVVDGAKAGRIVALVKDETLIGRTGVQVAALRRTAEEVRVVPVEGVHPPSVNGAPVAPDGQPLAAGDILEIAGTRLEVVAPARGPSA